VYTVVFVHLDFEDAMQGITTMVRAFQIRAVREAL